MALDRSQRYPGRWLSPSADFPMGGPKNRTSPTSADGSYFEKDWIADSEAFFGALLNEAGEAVNNIADTAQSSQLHSAMQKAREVSPRNDQWNGYLDPEHQSKLPASNGYPATSGGGGTAYTADQEISYGIFAGASGATVSSDSDGWIVSGGSIYRLYTYTTEQLADIDVNTTPIFIRDEVGNNYYINNSTTGVTVSKPNTTTLRIELDSGLFAALGITKLWRWFDTDKAGYVVEMSSSSLIDKLLPRLLSLRTWQDVSLSRTAGVPYTNNEVYPVDVVVQIASASNTAFTVNSDNFVNHNFSLITSVTVQPDDVYVEQSANILSWRELRI